MELSPTLHAAAVALLAAAPRGTFRAGSVRSVCGDVTTWTPPPGPWVVYLFNPFSASVLARALEALLAARGARDPTWVLYRNPEHAAVIDRDARWTWLGRVEDVAIYEAPAWDAP